MRKVSKLSAIIAVITAVAMLCACGDTPDASQMPESEAAVSEAPETSAAQEVSEVESEGVTDAATETATESEETTAEETKEETTVEETVDMSKVTTFDKAKTMYVQNPVNVRKGPSTDYEIVGHYSQNQKIEVIGQYEKDGWYEVELNKEPAFVSNKYVGENEVDLTALTLPAATNAQTQAQAQTAPAAPTAQKVVAAPAGVLFIGDSRCVQMREVTGGGGCSWICENSKGYNWLVDTALGRADACIGKGTKVVVCLGVNDPGNASRYASLINAKAVEWAARGAKTYYVSCNPVWENPYTTEQQVQTFNQTIAGSLVGVRYIDTHSMLMATGYKMVDGMHYDAATNLTIFNAIVSSL